jgi:hypothetical protein
MSERSPQDLRAKAKSLRQSASRPRNGLSDADRKDLRRLAYNLEKIAAGKARRLANGLHPEHPTKQ